MFNTCRMKIIFLPVMEISFFLAQRWPSAFSVNLAQLIPDSPTVRPMSRRRKTSMRRSKTASMASPGGGRKFGMTLRRDFFSETEKALKAAHAPLFWTVARRASTWAVQVRIVLWADISLWRKPALYSVFTKSEIVKTCPNQAEESETERQHKSRRLRTRIHSHFCRR